MMSQWKFPPRVWAKIQLISCDRQKTGETEHWTLLTFDTHFPAPCYYWHVISNAAGHKLWNVCSSQTLMLQWCMFSSSGSGLQQINRAAAQEIIWSAEGDSNLCWESITKSLTHLVFSYVYVYKKYNPCFMSQTSSKCCRTSPAQSHHHVSSQTINIICIGQCKKISTSLVFSSFPIILLWFKIVRTLFASLLIMKLKWCFCYL